MQIMINFENSFHKLNSDFYEDVIPSKPPKPELISFNKSLSNLLGIKISWIESIEGLECFTGKQVIKNSNPLAMVYAGHQFGNWVPRLGDGRAILLGEILDQNNERWDIQLKGSGLTPFSRNGDGKAALGPVLREYLMSEAMHQLGIPTTLALFIAKTGENVYREKVFPGAIITRVAKSHIRVGTFQYFASLGKYNLVKELMDYVIKRNFPEITTNQNLFVEDSYKDKEGNSVKHDFEFYVDGIEYDGKIFQLDNLTFNTAHSRLWVWKYDKEISSFGLDYLTSAKINWGFRGQAGPPIVHQ